MRVPGLGVFQENCVRSVVSEKVTAEVYTAGVGPCSPIDSHAHAEYQITLSPNSNGNYHYRGARHDIPMQSVSFIHPGEGHACGKKGFRETQACWKVLMLSPELVREFCGEVMFVSDFTTTNKDVYRSFDRYFNCIWNDCPLAEESLVEAFQTQRAFRQPNLLPRDVRWRLEKARKFLDSTPAHKPTSDEIAAVAGLNKYYFIRSFKKIYGITPQRYLLARRVDHAKRRLSEGLLELAEIAIECGFSDQSHMTRTFKKFVGVTPTHYC